MPTCLPNTGARLYTAAVSVKRFRGEEAGHGGIQSEQASIFLQSNVKQLKEMMDVPSLTVLSEMQAGHEPVRYYCLINFELIIRL